MVGSGIFGEENPALTLKELQKKLKMIKIKTMIEFKSVSKIYKLEDGDLSALENINLKINDGEFVVILGRSGSGKSTLLNILSGMDRPSSGDIFLTGKIWSR